MIEYIGKPASIICEVTCGAEMCDPILRLDIPGSSGDNSGVIKYLPADNGASELYLLTYIVSRRNNNATVAEFNIIPRGFSLNGAVATCGASLDDITAQIDFVLVFNPRPLASCTCAALRSSGLYASLIICISLITLIIIVLLTPIIIGCFVMRYRYRKKITAIEEQALLMKPEHVAEEEVKPKETSMGQDLGHDNNSRSQTKLNDKLPDTISSRSV